MNKNGHPKAEAADPTSQLNYRIAGPTNEKRHLPPSGLGAGIVTELLTRLDRVRKVKGGWVACCPAHNDKRPSLSISQGDDGRILLHCFSGCQPADVSAAIGLTLADLFPDRLKPQTPAERRKLRELARHAQWRAALNVVGREAVIIRIAADDLAVGRKLSGADRERVGRAHDLITNACGVLK